MKKQTKKVVKKSKRTPRGPKLYIPTRFSMRGALIFIIAFGAIGAITLFLTRAATVTLATVEAENMVPSTGNSITADGVGVAFMTNSTISGSFSVPTNATVNGMTVRAKGDQCSGAPQMIVTVDGKVQTHSVSATGWTDYSAVTTIASGEHAITIGFSNDNTVTKGKSGAIKCSRNLYVDKVTFTGEDTTPTPVPDPGGGTAAPFPSRLKASGRNIVDENNYILPKLKGFNMHVGPGFTWDQSHFNDIAAQGGKINRAVLHWDQFEPSQGAVNTTAINNLDLHIARAQAAGMYTLLEVHLNVGRSPSWTSAYPTEMEKYANYGQTLTQYLADRYGDPTSPKFTKAVIGFGLNEPPLEDNTIRNGNASIPYLEDKQRQMISWMRSTGYAPNWIGFVAVGYAGATPIYDDTWQNSSAADASPTAYNAVGGNVVFDLHDYMAGCTGTKSTDPNCDGRQYNGMNYPTYQGGPQIGTDSTSHTYASTATTRGQLAAYVKPYKTFTTQASIPLMLGEWGWPSGDTVSAELAWITDKKAIWTDAGTAIEIHWNYDVSASNTEWAARPGGVWRPSVAEWLKP